jgi:hypothetical protein
MLQKLPILRFWSVFNQMCCDMEFSSDTVNLGQMVLLFRSRKARPGLLSGTKTPGEQPAHLDPSLW